MTSARQEAAINPQGGARTAVARWVALNVASTSLAWLPPGARSIAADAAACTAREVREEGWDPATRTFTAFAPAVGVEASSLLLSLSGLIAADDPAMARTVERVADALSAPCGLLYRYETARGLEGPSIVCTYWLVRCLAAEGQLERAEALFEQTTAYANDVGLLSEQSDPSTGQLLGNFPYAASHAGLILAARDLYTFRNSLSRAARTNRRR
jgi:GH15 family glucan-1,4-alpha-glucosidase